MSQTARTPRDAVALQTSLMYVWTRFSKPSGQLLLPRASKKCELVFCSLGLLKCKDLVMEKESNSLGTRDSLKGSLGVKPLSSVSLWSQSQVRRGQSSRQTVMSTNIEQGTFGHLNSQLSFMAPSASLLSCCCNCCMLIVAHLVFYGETESRSPKHRGLNSVGYDLKRIHFFSFSMTFWLALLYFGIIMKNQSICQAITFTFIVISVANKSW